MSRIQIKGSRHLRREFGCVLAGCLRPFQNGFRVLYRTTQELLESRLRLALVALALPLTVGTLHAQLPNPVCYIPFDEGTGNIAHDAAGSNNATLMGGAGWTKGIVGPFALSVPGTNGSYADIPADVVSTTQSFTVCAWVNFTSTSGYETFVSEDAGYQSAFFLQKRADSGTFTFTMNTGATSGPGTTVFADSGTTPAAGTWYHVAGVYDASSGSLSVYVNGVLADRTSPHRRARLSDTLGSATANITTVTSTG